MDKPVCKRLMIKRINNYIVCAVITLGLGVTGCSNTTAPTSSRADKTVTRKVTHVMVAEPSKAEQRQAKEANQQKRETNKAKLAQQKKKQQHAANVAAQNRYQKEFEAKRREYRQKWKREQRLAKQRQQRPQQSQAQRQQLTAQQRRQWQQRRQQLSAARSQRAHVNYSQHLSNAALSRLKHNVRYDGRYIPISYPNGDVPANIGVCTDTVIRSYRRLGVDLQRLVHEDISSAFYAYPNLAKWGLSEPDPNIDHRRVHNLKVFFSRHGQRLPVTRNARSYRPGDLVTWSLGGDQEHIGIVVNQRSPTDPNRYMIVHNVGEGEKMEDVLFKWPITGHFRYYPHYRQAYPQLASAR